MRAHDFGACIEQVLLHPAPGRDETAIEGATVGCTRFCDVFDEIVDGLHPTIKRDARFGFASVNQYFRWFHTLKARQILRECGYSACFYSVPDDHYVASKHQAVFSPHRALIEAREACDAPFDHLVDTWKRAYRASCEFA